MVWWALLLISVGFQLLSGLLNKTAAPKADEQPRLPQNDGSMPIPVVFGECLITAPQVLDYLDFKSEPIKKKNPATFGLTSITIGYRYYLGIVFGLCYAEGSHFSTNNPTLREVTIDNRQVYFANLHPPLPFGYEDIQINKPSFFGSKEQEGGIVTEFRFYDGSDPDGFLGVFKEADSYWEDQVQARESDPTLTMPHYKNLCYVVWKGPSSGITLGDYKSGYISNSTSLWPIGFKVSRYPVYFGAGTKTIGDAPATNGEHANPVECLAEVLTNADYGAGIPFAKLDNDTWDQAAFDVWSEGLGFDYLWNTLSTCEEMCSEILRYIDGVIWTDLQNGLIKIKLARQESLVGVATYTNDDFLEIESFSRGSWEDTKNEIKISFPDHSKVDFEESTFTYFERANFGIQGESKVEAITYQGCPTFALASRLASREARGLSRPLARFKGKIDRKLWQGYPAGLFKFSWPEQGVTNLVLRITNIKLGTLNEGTITVDAVEDVFHSGEATYTAPTSTIWNDPLGGTAEDAEAAVGEIPYFYSRTDFNQVFGVAARPDSAHVAYDGALDGVIEEVNVDWTPRGLLVNTLPQVANGDYDTMGFTIDTLTDAEFVVAGTSTTIASEAASLAILGDPAGSHEWIAFESVSGTTTLTLDNVWRGLLDTPPLEWPADTPVWFFSVAGALFVNTLANGQTINFEALTRTPQDQLTSAGATDRNYTIQRRAVRPLPPYYVRLGGSYTNEQQDTGDLVFTWREHSRLAITQVLKQSATTETAESGITYEIDIYNFSTGVPVLLRNVTGLSSPTYTYTNTDELTDLGSSTLATALKMDFFSKRDGLRSLYAWTRYTYRVDPGSFGNSDWILQADVFDDAQSSNSVTGWDELGVEVFT